MHFLVLAVVANHWVQIKCKLDTQKYTLEYFSKHLLFIWHRAKGQIKLCAKTFVLIQRNYWSHTCTCNLRYGSFAHVFDDTLTSQKSKSTNKLLNTVLHSIPLIWSKITSVLHTIPPFCVSTFMMSPFSS